MTARSASEGVVQWPQGTPLDVDPVLVLEDQSPKSWFVTVATSFALGGFALTPIGRSWFGVAPLPIVLFGVLHAFEYARGVFWVGGPAQCGLRWRRRAFEYLLTLSYAAVYGACASSAASPGYAVLVAATIVFAQSAPGNRLFGAMLVTVPVALRAIFVPDATGASLWIAVAMGAFAAAVYFGVSVRSIRVLRLRQQVLSTAELTRGVLDREARLGVAMSLHDGLSGALFAARQRAAASERFEQVMDIGRRALLRAFEVVEPGGRWTAGVGSELEAGLHASMSALGVSGTVDLVGALPGAEDEAEDIRDIAVEAIANAAKHGGSSIALRVGFGKVIRIDCTTATPNAARAGVGRGLRNAELRAKSRGGGASWGATSAGFGLHVWWPSGETSRELSPAHLLAETTVALLLTLALAFANGSAGAMVAPLVAIAFGFWVSMGFNRRLAALRQELRTGQGARRAAERTPVLSAVALLLEPKLGALAAALRSTEIPAVRAALDDLAVAVGDLIWALEWRGDPLASAAPRRAVPPELAALLAARQAERGTRGPPAPAPALVGVSSPG